jgi:hypothetical protein
MMETKNTNFFHNQPKFRQSRNNVMKITLEDGIVMTDFEDIKMDARNHFVELYTQREEADCSNINYMLEHIHSMVTNDENLDLNRPISEEEIFCNHMESKAREGLGTRMVYLSHLAFILEPNKL